MVPDKVAALVATGGRRVLALEPISAEAFAPFGQLLPPLAPGHPRFDVLEDLRNGRAGARPRLSITAIEPRALPFAVTEMERHVHSSQAFVPMDCASYVVAVAPHGADGGPDAAGLRAFRVPGDTGINYRPDTWHHPVTVLERGGRFAVLTFVDGSAGDEQFAALAEPVLLQA